MKNSVLIMGIDGVSWDLLRPWIEDGKLPTLSRLVQKGASGNLKTVIPPLSCTAWTSLFTGTNPGKHGIYEYTTESGKLINSKLKQLRAASESAPALRPRWYPKRAIGNRRPRSLVLSAPGPGLGVLQF